ncbi:MAG: TonB-dependent receptor [Pseudomonadales bacterium]
MNIAKRPIAAVIALVSITGINVAKADGLVLEEVTVTATRRAQSVNEIPYNITAITSDDLDRSGITNMAGVMNSVPGIVYADQGPRANSANSGIVLRGLSVQSQAVGGVFGNLTVPTVSSYMDDTPIFMSLQLTDIERVEVLRGPQGTLYGSGSLAGTVRFIHHRPSVDAIEGNIGGSVEALGESSDYTYGAEGMFNLPMGEKAALRIAGTYENRGGVIDYTDVVVYDDGYPVLEDPDDYLYSPAETMRVDDADSAKSYSIRGSLLWEPTESLGFLLVHHRQHMEADGDNYRDLDSSGYESSAAFINQFDNDVELTSLEIDVDLGFATLTSSTSFSKNEIEQQRDIGYLQTYLDGIPMPYIVPGLGAYDRPGCVFYGCFPRVTLQGDEPGSREDTTQEFRLVSNGDSNIDWLLGAYFNKQDTEFTFDDWMPGYAEWANYPDSAAPVASALYDEDFTEFYGLSYYEAWQYPGGVKQPEVGVPVYHYDRTVEFEDRAIYGELTWHVTDDWQITGGLRTFKQEYTASVLSLFTNCGVLCSDPDLSDEFYEDLNEAAGRTDIDPTWGVAASNTSKDESDTIFKINTSYQVGEQNIYFTWAEGFRHGGANALPVGFGGITEDDIEYEADVTTNWEIGIKGYLMEGQLQYTLAAFFIEWDKPQIDAFVSIAALPAVINGEAAESKGLEAALNGNITENLSFSVSYNYTNAELTEDFETAGVVGIAGSPLPGVAKNMANGALDYNLPQVIGSFDLTLHLDGRYKGKARNDLAGGVNDAPLDAYSMWNGSIGLVNDSWNINFFVSNLLDEQDGVNAKALQAGTNYEQIERPRSYGLRAKYSF